MNFGVIKIWTWIVLFLITLVYEYLYIRYILAVSKLQAVKTTAFSLMLTLVGMASVILYTEDMNNCIPILAATGLGTYYIIENERKKRAKEDKKDK